MSSTTSMAPLLVAVSSLFNASVILQQAQQKYRPIQMAIRQLIQTIQSSKLFQSFIVQNRMNEAIPIGFTFSRQSAQMKCVRVRTEVRRHKIPQVKQQTWIRWFSNRDRLLDVRREEISYWMQLIILCGLFSSMPLIIFLYQICLFAQQTNINCIDSINYKNKIFLFISLNAKHSIAQSNPIILFTFLTIFYYQLLFCYITPNIYRRFMHSLRNITNSQHFHNSLHSVPSLQPIEKKIVHELDNEGCKCTLCQKIVIKEMKVVKRTDFRDVQSEQTMGAKEEYLTQFLNEFFFIDKLNRKIKILLPEMCIFQKGNPTCLITKKKDILPLKLLKQKQKMNAFEIQNFFMDGYIYHNNLKQNEQIMKNHKVTTLKKQYYKFDDYLKNECIVLVKFINGSCQMMTPLELSNLFKCKQKSLRQEILYIQTMACADSYNQLRVHIDLTTREYQLEINDLYERAKNQVKMINENIKPKDFMFVPEREERKFEEELKKKNQKDYLKYLALKFLLIHSLKTNILLEKCLFKFMKDTKTGYYYINDLQVYQKGSASRLWGEFDKKKAESPVKAPVKRRPASSPEKLQTRKMPTESQNEENVNLQLKKLLVEVQDNDNFSYNTRKPQALDSKRQNKKVEDRLKGVSLVKLEPIKRNSQRTRRLMSSLITKNDDTSRMLKRFL